MTRRFSLLVDDRPETLLRVTGPVPAPPRRRRRAPLRALARRCAAARGSTSSWPSPSATAAGCAERLGALVEVRDVAELQSVG